MIDSMTIPKTLAIDVGTVRIGLAVSYGTLAEPLKIIPVDGTEIDAIMAICAEEGIAQLLVGISEAEMALYSRAFAEELQRVLNLPILFADETLSSYEATARQLQHSNPGTHRKHIDDKAAAVFLQEWLEVQTDVAQQLPHHLK